MLCSQIVPSDLVAKLTRGFMFASFIIPHKGREDLLKKTVESILNLDFDLKKIEVVVVTQNAVLECPYVQPGSVQIKIIFGAIQETISSLRNKGVRNASGEYIAFVDADIQLSSNWLALMKKELSGKPECVIASATQRCGVHAGVIEKIRVIMNSSSADKNVDFLSTANLFMSRHIFEKVGGFPEDMVTCEDYYFTNKANEHGTLYATSKASFVHLGEDKSFFELFSKEVWRSQANLRTIHSRKMTLRELPSLLIPLWQTFFFLALLFSVFTMKYFFVIICLAMLLFPVILLCIKNF